MDPLSTNLVRDLRLHAQQNQHDKPNYWANRPETLISHSTVQSIAFGTGHGLFRSSILPAIERAEHEVILVTCFWARSATLTDLGESLRKLSARARGSGRRIRVRICFSSCSITQKLFHTRSLRGQVYHPEVWQKTLGLPDPKELVGLDLVVKSIFILPFSVMHPKFVLLDRRQVLVPSCNVSWEDWFEGCIELTGAITTQFYQFYDRFWATKNDSDQELMPSIVSGERSVKSVSTMNSSDVIITSQLFEPNDTPTVFLPSPHHANPRLSLPWKPYRRAPSTPLNIYILALFAKAERTIELQTPNLTAAPILDAIRLALGRGVDVTIVTSDKLMILEQLVTAGTTTSRCVQKLIRFHQKLSRATDVTSPPDLEAGLMTGHQIGGLKISYFHTKQSNQAAYIEPVQSHLKLTVVDGRVVILGSGNMDRASWYTSQELGIALVSSTLAADIKARRDEAMIGRTRLIYEENGV